MDTNTIGSRILLAVLFCLSLGGAFAQDRPDGESKIATPAQRAVLALICAPHDTVGVNCRKPRNFRGDIQGVVCNVDLSGDLYTVENGDVTFMVAPYTSDCVSHANNFGGSVLLQKDNIHWKFVRYVNGAALGDGCRVVRESSLRQLIFCLSTDMHQGVTNSDLSAYGIDNSEAGPANLKSVKTVVSGLDTVEFNNYETVTCDRRVDFFTVDNLAPGPQVGTLAVDVAYADEATIRAACAPGAVKPKTDFPAEAGQALIPPTAVKKTRWVYDVQSGEFTTLERYLGASAPPAKDASGAGKVIPPSDKRIALIIGNSQYAHAPALTNPRADAQAFSEKLRALGFHDVQILIDADLRTMLTALGRFAAAASDADWALVYYAGHGLSIDGHNYLVPVDATLASDTQTGFETVSLDQVMDAAASAKMLRLVILDACRDNPFVSKMRVTRSTRSITRGLAPVEPSAGALVAYAARDGGTADDGAGEHSPFTSALLRRLGEPDVELNLTFRRVRDDVLSLTANRQEPAVYGSLPSQEYYFARTR